MGRKLARTDAFKCSSYKLFYLLDQVVRHCIRSCAGTKYFAAVLILLQQEGHKFVHDEVLLLNLELNTLDRWILSFTQSLVLFVHQEMAGKCGNQSVLWETKIRLHYYWVGYLGLVLAAVVSKCALSFT